MLCGLPIIKEAAEGFFLEFDAKADFPVSLALIASVVIGENFAAGEVAVIMQPGVLLEEMAVAKAGSGIEKIVRLTPETACVIRNGRELMVPAGSVALNEHVRVLPGERIPAVNVRASFGLVRKAFPAGRKSRNPFQIRASFGSIMTQKGKCQEGPRNRQKRQGISRCCNDADVVKKKPRRSGG